MAAVWLEHVARHFGDVAVDDDVSMEIANKEFLVLVGPSGCGKSTILRMIAGLEDMSGGDTYIGDRRVNDVAPKGCDIAMVFQNYALYPHMNVFDNMAFGLKLRHTSKQEISRRIHEAAEVLDIRQLLSRKPRELSGGQRQRVALGRTIVREPQAFLMDEPLSNLDAKLRVQTRLELTRLHGRLQSTVIYVTHDQVEAMTMGSRIAILRNGKLQQLDSPAEIYAHPGNMFVAGFIGSPAMNFFAADLERRDGEVHARASALDLALPADLVARCSSYPGNKVIVGVRPEDIHESRRLPEGDTQSSVARVDVVEHMGNENFIYMTLGQSSFMARMDSSVQVRPGDSLPISIDTRKIHLFDPETEKAILAHSGDPRGQAVPIDRPRT